MRSAWGIKPAIAVPLVVVLAVGLIWLLVRSESGPVDLAVYRAAGEVVWNGNSAIYADDFGSQTGTFLPFTYPPIAALLSVPLAAFPLGIDYVIWIAVSGWLFARYVGREILTTRLGRVVGLALIVAVAFWILPVTETLILGQLGILLTLGCIAGSTGRHSWTAAVIGVLAAVKLTPLLFILYFALTRQWRRLAWSLGAFAGATAVGFVALPSESWQYFTELIGRGDRIGDPGYYSNQSIAGALARLGVEGIPWVVLAGAVLIAGLWLARRWFLAGSPVGGAIAIGLTTVLISPISWQHHAVWIVPGLILIYKTSTAKPVTITLGVLLFLSLLRLPQWASGADPVGVGMVPVGLALDAIALVVAALGVLMFIARPRLAPSADLPAEDR